MKLGIHKRRLANILLILPFFEPDCISFFESMDYLKIFFSISRVLVTFYMISQYFFGKKDYKIPIKIFAIYELSIIFVNIINGTIYMGFIVSCFNSIGFFILNYYLFFKSPLEYFKSYKKLMGLFLIVNFIFQIIYPNGIVPERLGDNRIWLLGTKNGVTTFAIIFLLAYFSSYLLENGKVGVEEKLILIYMTIIMVYGRSTTLIIGITLFIGIFSCLSYLKISKRSFKVIVLIIIAFIGIIFCTELKNIIVSFIAEITGKDVTFSGRIAIWKQAFDYFKESPFVGKGIGLSFTPWTNGAVVFSAHSVYFELLSKYGIVPSILYIVMLTKGWVGLIRNKNQINNIAISFVTVFILISGFEAYNDYIRTFVIAYSSYILTLGDDRNFLKIMRRGN